MRMHKLDQLWERVNALGGTFEPGDEYARGIVETVETVLGMIEDLGGTDPLLRPDLTALAKTLRLQCTRHVNTGKGHLYEHDIIDERGKVIARRQRYRPKNGTTITDYLMDGKDYATTAQFLTVYRDKLRASEAAAPPNTRGNS